MGVGGKVRAAPNVSGRVDVDCRFAGSTVLAHLAANEPRQLRKVEIGVADHAPPGPLVRHQLGDQCVEALKLPAAHKMFGVSVLEIGVDRQVHARADAGCVPHDRHDLVEIVVPDDRVETDRHVARRHPRHQLEDLRREARDPASRVVTRIEIVQGDAELRQPRLPQRLGSLERQHAAVGDEREPRDRRGARDLGDDLFQIASQQRLTARERDHHRRVVARRVGERTEFACLLGWIGLPVVTEGAAGVTALRDLEMHQHGAAQQPELRVLVREGEQMPWLESS